MALPQTTKLPPDVQAALLRGDRVEAMQLMRQHLGASDSPALAAVSAALATGDARAAGALLRGAVEGILGRSIGKAGAVEGISAGHAEGLPASMRAGNADGLPASIHAGNADGLAPGEVPRRSWFPITLWILAAALGAALLYDRFAA